MPYFFAASRAPRILSSCVGLTFLFYFRKQIKCETRGGGSNSWSLYDFPRLPFSLHYSLPFLFPLFGRKRLGGGGAQASRAPRVCQYFFFLIGVWLNLFTYLSKLHEQRSPLLYQGLATLAYKREKYCENVYKVKTLSKVDHYET